MSAAGLARDANDGAVEPPSRSCGTADGCIASCQSVPDMAVGISLIGRPDKARRNSGIAGRGRTLTMPRDVAERADLAAARSTTVSAARVCRATWLGWMRDGFDSGISMFVPVPP